MKALERLKALNLPHATPAIFDAKVADDAPDREQAEKYLTILAEYLKDFVPPGDCICCGSRLGAKDVMDSIVSAPTFRWGLVHGEGECSKCGYPARAMHYIGKTETAPEIMVLRNYILQYHPSVFQPEEEGEGGASSPQFTC